MFFYLLYQTRHKKPICKHSNSKESRCKFIILVIQLIFWMLIDDLFIIHVLACLKLIKTR
jgi:hypothetical protein